MAIPQQKFREIVFQIIYSYDIGPPKDEDILSLLMKELSVTRKTVKDALALAKIIQSHQNEIDEIIAKASTSYAFERIQTVERNILRLGTFELNFYSDKIPPKVAIAEAMRLARKFGTPESAAFVNAILDHIYKSSKGVQTSPDEIQNSVDSLKRSEALAEEVSLLPPNPVVEKDDD